MKTLFKISFAFLVLGLYIYSVILIISGRITEGSLLLIAISVCDYVNKDMFEE